VASYQTIDGTAKSGIDYTGTNNGLVTIPSGSATGTIAVPILSSTALKDNLTFSVEFTGIKNVIGPAVSLAGQQTFSTETKPQYVAVADINNDGRPDLIAANVGSASVSVLLNTTPTGAMTASFATQQTFSTGATPTSVAVADINGDGKPDLIVANF